MKKLSKETKDKIALITVYAAVIVFCILWLRAEINISRFSKWKSLYAESSLSQAVSSLEGFQKSGDEKQWEDAALQLREFGALGMETVVGSEMNPHGLKADKYPAPSVETLSDCLVVSAYMLFEPDTVKPYAGELSAALSDICKNPLGKEGAERLNEIRAALDKAANR